ncbi:MAG TPA: class I SAM-dependent methyltransferase [Euzebyales bacterium]
MAHAHDRDRVLTWPRLYDWSGRWCTFGARDRAMARGAGLVAEHAPRAVLDVGSGTGALSFALARRMPGGDVVGIEPSEAMVAYAHAKAARLGLDVDFRQGYAQDLPVSDDAVDAVTISLALHHVAEDRVPDALAEARRVLRPGGLLFVIEFAPVGRVAPLLVGRHGPSVSDFVEHIRGAGFIDVRVGRISPRVLGFVSGVAS